MRSREDIAAYGDGRSGLSTPGRRQTEEHIAAFLETLLDIRELSIETNALLRDLVAEAKRGRP